MEEVAIFDSQLQLHILDKPHATNECVFLHVSKLLSSVTEFSSVKFGLELSRLQPVRVSIGTLFIHFFWPPFHW